MSLQQLYADLIQVDSSAYPTPDLALVEEEEEEEEVSPGR